MAKDIDVVDLFEEETVDEKALLRVAKRYDALDYDDLSNPHVMSTFYRRLFPAKQLYLWLNQEQVPSTNWTHREIAFTLANDAYLRYNSFSSHLDFHKEVIRLNPARFEIGAIYNARPKDKRTQLKTAGGLKPLRRELVFDIDMTDYDEIRTCCQGKGICRRCWRFISSAVKVLDRTLRDDFGFNHLLWVYSGRRGIHCWISDVAALELSDEQRKGIVGYIEVIKGGASQHKKVELHRPLHPALKTNLENLLEPFTRIILQDQDCFRSVKGWEALLSLLPSSEERLVKLKQDLENKWRNGEELSSKERWGMLASMSQETVRDETNPKKKFVLSDKLNAALEDIKLQYLYPRIDAEVSKHQNHLLKSPFVVHPGTGRVCVPVDPARVEAFDPESVPTVGMLLRELDRVKVEPGTASQEGEQAKEANWEMTSLKPYVDLFEKHIQGVLRDNTRAKRAVKAETFDF